MKENSRKINDGDMESSDGSTAEFSKGMWKNSKGHSAILMCVLIFILNELILYWKFNQVRFTWYRNNPVLAILKNKTNYIRQRGNFSIGKYLSRGKESHNNQDKNELTNSRNRYQMYNSNNRRSELGHIKNPSSDPFEIMKKHKEMFNKHNWNLANLMN